MGFTQFRHDKRVSPTRFMKKPPVAGVFANKLAISLVVAVLAWPSHAQLPTLGDGAELSVSAERRMGERIMRELYRDPDYLDDPVLGEYLQSLWRPLLRAARERGDLSPELSDKLAWDIVIGRDRTVNAFALPGGYLGVHLGLIGITTSRDELASVLAHELSHVTQRHIARLIAKQNQQTPLVIGAIILGAIAASKSPDAAQAAMVGGQALAAQNQLNFSRDMEREADRVGFGVLAQAGFDPRGFVGMFGKLQMANRLSDNGSFPYLRSHPLTTERMADMQARAPDGAGRGAAVGPSAGVGPLNPNPAPGSTPGSTTGASPSAHPQAGGRSEVRGSQSGSVRLDGAVQPEPMRATTTSAAPVTSTSTAAPTSAVAKPRSSSNAAPAADYEHALMAARARALSDPRAEAQRSFVAQAQSLVASVSANPSASPAEAATQAAQLYAGALAAARLREPSTAETLLSRLKTALAGVGTTQLAINLLASEIALQAGHAQQALQALGPGAASASSRAVQMQFAQAQMAAGRHAQAAQQLQLWVADKTQDALAWQLLAQARAATQEPLRSIRAEAEARLAQLDYPAAIDRLRAAQDLARSPGMRGQDENEAIIIDTRLRQVQAQWQEIQREERAGR
jgi:beta-barrel assembly-enhancing protease